MLQVVESVKTPYVYTSSARCVSEGVCISRFQIKPPVSFECGGLSCVYRLEVACLSGEKLHVSHKPSIPETGRVSPLALEYFAKQCQLLY